MTRERRVTAFMEDPHADKPNAIHSTAGARDYGFRGALVGGATAYGWAARTIIDALGEEWLGHGWAMVRFKQPVYPEDILLVRVDDDGGLSVVRETDGTLCFGGAVGLGDAPWLADIEKPDRRDPEPRSDQNPSLTLAHAPVGQTLKSRALPFSVGDAQAYARDKEHEELECFYGDAPLVHPAWIAEQPIHWLHHSYDYGPAIHTQSHIQHLRPALAGQAFVIAGKCREAYERKGHHYIVNDTEIRDATDEVVARVRHTAIFRVARTA